MNRVTLRPAGGRSAILLSCRSRGRILLLAGVLAVLALGVFACGDDDPAAPNLGPSVTFVERPVEGGRVGATVTFRWTAADPDGRVARYETSLDGDTTFTATTDTVAVLTFTREDGVDSRPGAHVFRVRAVDDDGLAGAAAVANFQVAIFNQPPTVALNTFPSLEGYVGPTARLGWSGSDPDGSIARWEYALDDTLGGWTAHPDTFVVLDFSDVPLKPASRDGRFVPLNRPVRYFFYLRAVDNEDKASATVFTSFLAGPENVPPTIELLREPTGVVAKEATWKWRADDPDGGILRVQYAIDLESPAGWRRWDGDSLTVEFTRADGTAENPLAHTFHLRAQDDDSTYSAVIVRPFTVGVPNQPPTISFTQRPAEGATVLYRFAYGWAGLDDIGIDYYEYAVDDSVKDGQPAWVRTTATSVQLNFAATEVDPATCNPNAGCIAYGNHRFFVRAFDRLGLRSRTIASDISCLNRTPVSTITAPVADANGEVVAGGDAVPLAWSVFDAETGTAGTKPVSAWLVREVTDFAEFPDGASAVNDLPAGTDWTAAGSPNVRSTTLALESGKRYIVAVRSRDEANATDALFTYGKNVIKIVVP